MIFEDIRGGLYSLEADPKRMIKKRFSTILVKWIKIFGMSFTAYLIDLLKVLVKDKDVT